MLCALRNQVAPYENEKGAADRMMDRWIAPVSYTHLLGGAVLGGSVQAAVVGPLVQHTGGELLYLSLIHI